MGAERPGGSKWPYSAWLLSGERCEKADTALGSALDPGCVKTDESDTVFPL
jgi:hypothetical protein